MEIENAREKSWNLLAERMRAVGHDKADTLYSICYIETLYGLLDYEDAVAQLDDEQLKSLFSQIQQSFTSFNPYDFIEEGIRQYFDELKPIPEDIDDIVIALGDIWDLNQSYYDWYADLTQDIKDWRYKNESEPAWDEFRSRYRELEA